MTREALIQTLIEMGFSEAQAIGALNASKDDLNKAIVFLFGEADEIGSASEQQPVHMEQMQSGNFGSVAILNPSDIPDFLNISQTELSIEKAELLTLLDHNSSIQESISDLNCAQEKVDGVCRVSEAELVDAESVLDEPFPPSEKSESHQFPVILNKVRALRAWVPLISILSNFHPFVQSLEKSESKEPLVKELLKIAKHFTSFAESSLWYVTTEGLAEYLPVDFPHAGYADDEMLLNMMTFLKTLEPVLKPLFESTVESVEDNIHNELVVLEIESESRMSTIYETLNELFWQKDYEFFGKIKYSYVAPLVMYQLEHDESTTCTPFELQETFYPEIYSDKALKYVEEELESMASAEQKYQEVNKKLMELNFFLGMRVDSLLQTAASLLASHSPESASDLEHLIGTLGHQRAEEIERQKTYKLEASPLRLKLFDRLVSRNPDLQSYTLLGVILSETQYFMRYNGSWINMATTTATDFAAVKRYVEVASRVGPHLITLIYELLSRLQE